MNWQTLGSDLPRQGNPISKWVGRGMLRVLGWKIQGEFPNRSKLIVALAPHTTAWDFALTVAVLWGLGLRASFLAKHSLFSFPLGFFMRAFGGIPVDRTASQGMVGRMTEEFSLRPKLVLGITPEGTRGKVREWKKGFALIAQSANVPVLPAILHSADKTVRFEPLIHDVTDPDRVLTQVKALAAQAQG